MPDALEIIEKVLSQHYKITENVKTTGERMNDVDAIFNVQVAAYKTAQSAFSVPELLKKRDELLRTIEILGEGLRNHFTYEEKVFPLLFGEILLKAILHDHSEIQGSIGKARTILANLHKMSQEELLTKRLELIESVNAVRSTVDSHAHYEENVLNAMRAVFEVKRESTGS